MRKKKVITEKWAHVVLKEKQSGSGQKPGRAAPVWGKVILGLIREAWGVLNDPVVPCV